MDINGHEFEKTLGIGDGQGRPGVLQSMKILQVPERHGIINTLLGINPGRTVELENFEQVLKSRRDTALS